MREAAVDLREARARVDLGDGPRVALDREPPASRKVAERQPVERRDVLRVDVRRAPEPLRDGERRERLRVPA